MDRLVPHYFFVVLVLVGCGSSTSYYQESPRRPANQPARPDRSLGDEVKKDNSEDAREHNDDDDRLVASNDPSDPGAVNPTNPSTVVPTPSIGSQGSGGATGQIEQTFTASNGKSASYKTVIPPDIGPSKTYGLNIHLHGDGGGDYGWLFQPNVRIAKEHGLIGVVVLAPNFQRRWYNDGMQNAKFLDELIQNEFFTKWNIDKSRVYFSGVSGGAQFLTGQFIPTYGAKYNSGAVLLCGGPGNWQNSINSTPEFISSFRLYWYSHTGDFLYDQIEAGIRYYKGLGMKVDSEIIPGGSHCDFDEGVSGALAKKLPLVLR
jgi:hypothetical protein